jgi:hypothetical protein
MIYDAPCSLPGASFAHLPIYGLEDLGFVPRGKAGAFIAERNTAPAQIPGAKVSLCHGIGGMFAAPAPSSCRMSRIESRLARN